MIYCIGDSFTFGAELPDTMNGQRYSQLAWPSKLSSKLNVSVTNLGKQACSNARILKRTMDCSYKNNTDAIIIAWTNPERFDVIDKLGVFSVWPNRNSSIMEPSRAQVVNLINKTHTGSMTNWYHRIWLRQVILLQTFLTVNKVKYIMVQSHYSQWNNRAYERKNQDLMDKVDPTYFLGWPYDGFVEWAFGCKEGPGGHFLEEGHEKVANKIYEYIRTFGWFS